MSTEKLYYKDSYINAFEATVTKVGDGFVALDATAFFPTAGGQMCDDGYLDECYVSSVKEKDGEILHYTDGSFTVGQKVTGRINFDERIRKMRNHSAEHIVSGIVNKLYGYENVGFHLSDVVTIDFSGELSSEQITCVEKMANEKVMENVPVEILWPNDEEVVNIEFRAKLELSEMSKVRLVKIGDTDLCACCAPHVRNTGEIGVIKILSAERHRGGMRLTMVAGIDAFNVFSQYQNSVTAISGILSVPREDVENGTRALMSEKDRVRLEKANLEMELVKSLPTDKNCVFVDLGPDAQREYCNILKEIHTVAAVFCGEKYVIGSKSVNLREKSKEINAAIDGRGGGRPEMISGTAKADRDIINNYFLNCL